MFSERLVFNAGFVHNESRKEMSTAHVRPRLVPVCKWPTYVYQVSRLLQVFFGFCGDISAFIFTSVFRLCLNNVADKLPPGRRRQLSQHSSAGRVFYTGSDPTKHPEEGVTSLSMSPVDPVNWCSDRVFGDPRIPLILWLNQYLLLHGSTQLRQQLLQVSVDVLLV